MLEHLQTHLPQTPVLYWRDKAQRELGFVLAYRRNTVDVVEGRRDPAAFDVAGLRVCRGHDPNGRNFLVTPSGAPACIKQFGMLQVRVCTPTASHE